MTIAVKSIVDGDSLNVSQFLKQNHYIPDYQRDFTWNNQKIKQLWGDIINLYSNNTVNDVLVSNPEGYYLGAAVTISQSGAPDDVVDGQQRLTALSTLAAVLAESSRALPAKHQPHGLVMTLEQLISQGLVGGKLIARLTFADPEMNEFYRQSTVVCTTRRERDVYWATAHAQELLKRAKGKSPMALLKAAFDTHYEALSAFLGSTKNAARAKRLALLTQILSECIVILKIAAGSYANAYTIFESLNYRGAPLSQADLIKNELLKLTPTSGGVNIVGFWRKLKELAEEVESVTLPELIYLSHISRYERVNGAQLFEDVKSKIRSGVKAAAYIENVKADAEALIILKNAQHTFWTDDSKWMLNDLFDVLRAKLSIPFLLSAYRSKGQHKSSAVEFEGLLKICMNFTYRYMKIGEGDTATFSKAINEAALAIARGSSAASISASLKSYAPDHEFRDRFKRFSTSRPKLAYFSIYWIERHLILGKGVVPLAHGIHQNIEHIMPKTPDADWPNSLALKNKDKDEFEYQLWRIGNMIPLPASLNKAIKNKNISKKLAAYPNANLESPKNLSKFLNGPEWDADSIDARQGALSTVAIKAWPL